MNVRLLLVLALVVFVPLQACGQETPSTSDGGATVSTASYTPDEGPVYEPLPVRFAPQAPPALPKNTVAPTDHVSPPNTSRVYDKVWGTSAKGQAPQMLYWEYVTHYRKKRDQMRSSSGKIRRRGAVPLMGLQSWQSTYPNSLPTGTFDGWKGKLHDRVGHRLWSEWVKAHPELVTRAKDGGSMPRWWRDQVADNGEVLNWGYVPQIQPIEPEHFDDGSFPKHYEGDQAYYADWIAQKLGTLAAQTGAQGLQLSDFWSTFPHASPAVHSFNPSIIADFEKRTGVDVQGDDIPAMASDILANHYGAWLDHYVDRWAYQWEAYVREIERYTGRDALILPQEAFSPSKARSLGATDARVVHESIPYDNILWNVNTWWRFMSKKSRDPESRSSAHLGIWVAREPSGRYVSAPEADHHWFRRKVRNVWTELDSEAQERLGDSRLKRSWLENGWTHVATREGHVRRAAEAFQRAMHNQGKINKTWLDLVQEVYPVRPFGPALYYSVGIERAWELDKPGGFYLNMDLEAITKYREAGIPFGYFASDVAIDSMQPEARPTAWIVPDRYLKGKDLLPESERKALEAIAPILSEEEAMNPANHPLRFEAQAEGRTATGYGFFDQKGRLVVTVSDKIEWDATQDPGPVDVHIEMDLPDGTYQVEELLTDETGSFNVNEGTGTLVTTLDAWDTKILAIKPAE